MRASRPALVVFLLLAGCSAHGDDSRGDEARSALAAASIAFVTTSSAARTACATELRTTYCSEAAAADADAACTSRLDEKERASCAGPCLVRYSPQRAECHDGPTFADAAACHAPLIDDCAFYRSCLEAAVPCGESAYALRFGERLCNTFIADEARFSEHGRTWLRAIRQCLERELVPELDSAPSCATLEDHAYASHTRCYTDPAHSICDLDHHDVLVLGELLGKDLFEPHAAEQLRGIIDACYGSK